ncbi:MAG: rod shape-determining protein MreD [Nitrospirae bacterium]|nr:rod shape-determining protein MreD [Nitrospirota bacterium]MBI3594767.1 rod shape-determining protein MreD [Nitrospirota bacterium]
MKGLLFFTLITMLIPLQGMIGDYISIGNIKPDLGFLAIYFTGLLYGNVRGALMGIGVGFIADILSGGTTFVQMESGLIIGFFAGLIRQALLNLRWFFNLLILFFFSLFYSMLVFSFLDLTSREVLMHYPWKELIIPKGVLDAFLGSLLFWILVKRFKIKEFLDEKDGFERLFFSSPGKS